MGALQLQAACILKGDLLQKTTDLPEQYKDYTDVASEEKAGILSLHQAHNHHIKLKPGTTSLHWPIYNLSENELQTLCEYIESAMVKGWIRPSTSPAGAPILFIPKKDSGLWLCVDYWGLNSITICNCYPLLLVLEILDQLGSTKIYIKLDLWDTYHCIWIEKGQEWMTAFQTCYRQFEYTIILFRLANAPATFQAYVNQVLSNLLDVCCVVYLDDILIYSDSEEEHVKHIHTVLEWLWKFNLFIKLLKCEFHTHKVNYIGFDVTPEGIEMEEDHVLTVNDWPEPTIVWEILIFIEFTNFY